MISSQIGYFSAAFKTYTQKTVIITLEFILYPSNALRDKKSCYRREAIHEMGVFLKDCYSSHSGMMCQTVNSL